MPFFDQFFHENKRFARFESANITIDNGDGTYDLNTAEREADRTSTGVASGNQFSVGDRAFLIAGGDTEQPEVIGNSTWITQ
jgi:hypothetical protein